MYKGSSRLDSVQKLKLTSLHSWNFNVLSKRGTANSSINWKHHLRIAHRPILQGSIPVSQGMSGWNYLSQLGSGYLQLHIAYLVILHNLPGPQSLIRKHFHPHPFFLNVYFKADQIYSVQNGRLVQYAASIVYSINIYPNFRHPRQTVQKLSLKDIPKFNNFFLYKVSCYYIHTAISKRFFFPFKIDATIIKI